MMTNIYLSNYLEHDIVIYFLSNLHFTILLKKKLLLEKPILCNIVSISLCNINTLADCTQKIRYCKLSDERNIENL
jgi:hypothetical protein